MCFWIALLSSCSGQGPRQTKGLKFAPEPISILGNRGVEKDARGRLGFWGEEKAAVLTEQRGGQFGFDELNQRSGKAAVVLKPQSSTNWYGIGSVNYPVPAWSDHFQLSGWSKCATGATAQLAAVWQDDSAKILRVDLGPTEHGLEWSRLQWNVTAPQGTYSLRLVALAKGKPVWFDDFDLLVLRPNRPVVKIFVNQVGYNAVGPKSAVLATNFLPSDNQPPVVELMDGSNAPMHRCQVAIPQRVHGGTADDWGWHFYRVEFSAFERSGRFRLYAALGAGAPSAATKSPAFEIGRRLLAERTMPLGVDFFFVQRCGFAVPGWHKPCHLDDAKLPDGTHIDVVGGWHSAGDYNKPMWQMGDSAAVYGLAVAADEMRDLCERFDRDRDGAFDALDEARWGAQFLAKMQNPANGSLRGDVNQGPRREWMRWTAPEVHTDNQIGTADDPVVAQPVGNAPLAIAGWARLADLLNRRKISNDYRERAERLWTYFASRPDASANSLLLIGSLELHSLTNGAAYLQSATTAVDELLAKQRANGSFPGDSGDHGDWTAAALAQFLMKFPMDRRASMLKTALRRYVDFCVARANNPFGVSQQAGDATHPVFFQQSTGLGVNFWLLGRAWAAGLIHRATGDRRALNYAVDQIDWVLGKNPANLCMMEGAGTINPPRYHHRYNQIPGRERGAVPGAIANGFVTEMGMADRPGFDLSRSGGRSPSFRTSEPWLVHNVLHLLALAAL